MAKINVNRETKEHNHAKIEKATQKNHFQSVLTTEVQNGEIKYKVDLACLNLFRNSSSYALRMPEPNASTSLAITGDEIVKF
jgi:hypothetical protein